MYYDTRKIEELRLVARNAKLEAPAEFGTIPPEGLARICNGIGAEWMGLKLRRKLTRLLCAVEASAAIHDLQYADSDGSEESRLAADNAFLKNGLREIAFRYPHWWQIRKIFARRKLHAAYEALRIAGRLAWLEAFAQRTQKEAKDETRK